MTARKRLSDRRATETFSIEASGLPYTISIGRFPDNSLAEIFISNGKAGSHADTAARDSAVICSLALQFGVDIHTLRNALARDPRGKALGPLGVALDLIANRDRLSPRT